MSTLDLIPAISAPLILGMIWLRTRVQYARRGSRLRLEQAGWIYFAGAACLMGVGWVIAPALGRMIWRATIPAGPIVLRVAWFLATYYLFIIVHQLMKAGGHAIFTATDST